MTIFIVMYVVSHRLPRISIWFLRNRKIHSKWNRIWRSMSKRLSTSSVNQKRTSSNLTTKSTPGYTSSTTGIISSLNFIMNSYKSMKVYVERFSEAEFNNWSATTSSFYQNFRWTEVVQSRRYNNIFRWFRIEESSVLS